MTPASGVGTTAVVLATARYYRSVLPPQSVTTVFVAGISQVLPFRVYRPIVCLYVIGGDKLSVMRRRPITSIHSPCTVARLYNVLYLSPSSAVRNT